MTETRTERITRWKVHAAHNRVDRAASAYEHCSSKANKRALDEASDALSRLIFGEAK